MNKLEVSLSNYIQVLMRFYTSLIRYKVGNFFDPPPKKKRGEFDWDWLEGITIAQAQRFTDYHWDKTVKGIAWTERTDLEAAGKEGRKLRKALNVSAVMVLNRFDEYRKRINQRIFEEKYR